MSLQKVANNNEMPPGNYSHLKNKKKKKIRERKMIQQRIP